MKKPYKILLLTAVVALVWVIGYAVGRNHFREVTKIIQTDTLVRYDTVRIEKPGQIRFFRSSVPIILPLTDTVRIRDTTYLILQREVREYRDSLYYARVSGYDPALEFIEIYPKTTTVSRTETVIQNPSPWDYSISFGIDYGCLWENYLSPNIGAELGCRKVVLGVECGLNVGVHEGALLTPRPYLQMSLKYRMAGR